MTIASASGYPNYSGNLIRPVYSSKILARLHCATMFSEIATNNALNEISRCGEQVTFWRAPRAVVHPYIKNQKLEHDALETDHLTFEVGEAVYFNLKIDDVDYQLICNAPQLIDAYTQDAVQQIKETIDLKGMRHMAESVAGFNQGCEAGAQTRSFDLGRIGDPLVVENGTGMDLMQLLVRLYSVLIEACVIAPPSNMAGSDKGSQALTGGGSGGEPFVVLPTAAYSHLMNNDRLNCCESGNGQAILTGRLPNPIAGFHIYFSRFVPFYEDNDTLVYEIIAGRRDAVAFVKTIEKMQEVNHPDYFGKLYRGLAAFGFGTLYPEALALARVRFA
jgi:hypothetical protein